MFSYPLSTTLALPSPMSAVQMFSYPFSRSGNETEDGTHFPRLEDLQYLCELAGIRLKVTPPSHPQPP